MTELIQPVTSSGPNSATCVSPGIAPHLHTTTEWHAIYVRHQHEIAVAHHLELLGFKVFLPLYREVRQWSDRRKQVNLPLFPCYVFFSGDPGVPNRRRAILNTPGVFSLVTSGGNVAVIPAAELEPIVRVAANSAVVAPHPFLHTGDHIRVYKGPLLGSTGLLCASGIRAGIRAGIRYVSFSLSTPSAGASLLKSMPRSLNRQPVQHEVFFG